MSSYSAKRSLSSTTGGGPVGRGPVSWTMFGIVGVAAAAAVSYYSIERERRMEEALGKVVSSKSVNTNFWDCVFCNKRQCL